MTKEAFYFSHDSNARNDERILAVRMRHGAEGYGIYFMILERLRESTDYMSVKDYNVIAFDLRVSADKVKSVVEDFNLFTTSEDGKHFYSESLLRRMERKDTVSKKRKEAAEKRWSKSIDNQNDNANAMQMHSKSNAIKEKKEKKESKENPPNPPLRVIEFSNQLDKIEHDCMQDEAWHETLAMGLRAVTRTPMIRNVEDVREWLEKFFLEIRGRDELKLNLRETKGHAYSWIKIELEKEERKNKFNPQPHPQTGKGTDRIREKYFKNQ